MPAQSLIKQEAAANIATPAAGYVALFLDSADGVLKVKDSSGTVHTLFSLVSSVFGRAGAVVATSGDYSVGQVTGAAPLASPTFTGTPAAPTPATSDNSTLLSTTAFVQAVLAGALAGFSWKQEVRAKTTGALPTNTYANGSSGIGATLTATANAALAAQDGVTLAANDRLLVANEATGANNGVYIVTQVGDGSHPYILTRATDVDTPAGLVNATVFVSEGTANADTLWTCTANVTITIGTTALVFAQVGLGVSTLAGLSDVTITSPANGDVLTYDTASGKWKNKPSATPARATVTVTTASLANGATENGTVTLAKSGHLYKLIVDRACRVELYATSADRTTDASRALGTPATPGMGVLCEFAPAAAGTTDAGPAVVYYNGDVSPSSSIYYAITNLSGSTSTVQVQFVHLGLES